MSDRPASFRNWRRLADVMVCLVLRAAPILPTDAFNELVEETDTTAQVLFCLPLSILQAEHDPSRYPWTTEDDRAFTADTSQKRDLFAAWLCLAFLRIRRVSIDSFEAGAPSTEAARLLEHVRDLAARLHVELPEFSPLDVDDVRRIMREAEGSE